MVERTGTADPVRVIPLLWGHSRAPGRSGLSLDVVVEAGIAIADEVGIEQVSMRKIADRLEAGAMSLYAYVPGKAELIELMVDSVLGEVQYEPGQHDPARWRAEMEEIAEKNWELLSRHRWLLDVDTTRPPLGPGTIGKYDAELHALVGTGLEDVEVDQVLGLLLEHVRSSARQFRAAEGLAAKAAESSDRDWWDRAGPLLAGVMDAQKYPRASRIGSSAGEEYDAPSDPRRAYAFGLHTLLTGVEALIARRSSGASPGQA